MEEIEVDKKKIDRISELSRKERAQGLTPEEKEEQAVLRREYIDAMRRNMRSVLESIEIKRD